MSTGRPNTRSSFRKPVRKGSPVIHRCANGELQFGSRSSAIGSKSHAQAEHGIGEFCITGVAQEQDRERHNKGRKLVGGRYGMACLVTGPSGEEGSGSFSPYRYGQP